MSRVRASYVAGAWLISQVTTTILFIFESLDWPKRVVVTVDTQGGRALMDLMS